MSAAGVVLLALAGGALIGMCAHELDGRHSQVARARLTLTLGIASALGITLALHLGWGGA